MRAPLFVLVLSLASMASAQSDETNAHERACERNWGCWELFYSTPQSLLGLRATLSRSEVDDTRAARDASLLVVYETQQHGVRNEVSAELALAGALGGGSAGSEGSLAGVLAIGWRPPVTEHSGPFVRFGWRGAMLGHEKLRVRVLEPLHARMGYQYLLDDVLLEAGLFSGLAVMPRYDVGGPGRWRRDEAATLGGFARLRMAAYRFEANITHLLASDTQPALDVARAALCGYRWSVALCAEAWLARANLSLPAGPLEHASSVYGGLTLGLTP